MVEFRSDTNWKKEKKYKKESWMDRDMDWDKKWCNYKGDMKLCLWDRRLKVNG